MNKLIGKLIIVFVRLYQVLLSPFLGQNCRHIPTCSQYTIEALQEWGAIKGTYLGVRRLMKCHPWGTHGYDPVPKNKKKNPKK